MENNNPNAPAFPRPSVHSDVLGFVEDAQSGMTLRQYYVGKAMQGLLSNEVLSSTILKLHSGDPGTSAKMFCQMALTYADTLITVLEENVTNV